MIRALVLESRLRVIVPLVAAIAIVGGVAPFAVARITALPDDAVFEYDGDVVTIDDLDERLVVLKALYGVERPADDGDFKRDAAKSMAVSEVLAAETDKRDIVISDKVAQDTLDKLIDQQMTDGRAAFDEFLATSGISEVDVLDEIKRQLATSRLVEEVTADVAAPSDEEVRSAYDEHQDSMVTPESRQLLNIVVASRADAERVLRLANSGTPFASLAATWSRDASTRDKGGDLGVLTADQLEADYAEAAFAVPVRGFFGPVETRFGWNVGQVAAVNAATALSFEQVRAQIATELQNKERLDVWRNYLSGLLRDADVEYADEYLPADPTAAPNDLPEN
ncbi:MAG TPA: peptidyl-prolyl cis-trans isomerase [Nocardioidaceae bacterium]|nr:peptidyl-prolyl cis-trans isomerase [Nocardioidaceae bacterium]